MRLTLAQMKTAYQVRQLIGDLSQDTLGDDSLLTAGDIADASPLETSSRGGR